LHAIFTHRSRTHKEEYIDGIKNVSADSLHAFNRAESHDAAAAAVCRQTTAACRQTTLFYVTEFSRSVRKYLDVRQSPITVPLTHLQINIVNE